MAGVGRYVAECRVWIESDFRLWFRVFWVLRIQWKEMVCLHPGFYRFG